MLAAAKDWRSKDVTTCVFVCVCVLGVRDVRLANKTRQCVWQNKAVCVGGVGGCFPTERKGWKTEKVFIFYLLTLDDNQDYNKTGRFNANFKG